MAKEKDADVPRFIHAQDFLAAISEKWTYSILREIFFGTTRFGGLRRSLGVAPNILTARLQTLIELDLISRTRYRKDKDWYEYELSDSARDLIVPAIVTMTRWAEARAVDGRPPRTLTHITCDHLTDPYLACSHCGGPLNADTIRPSVEDDPLHAASEPTRPASDQPSTGAKPLGS